MYFKPLKQYSYTQHQRKANTPTEYTPDPQHVHKIKLSRHDILKIIVKLFICTRILHL
jgi:hypothetical protein